MGQGCPYWTRSGRSRLSISFCTWVGRSDRSDGTEWRRKESSRLYRTTPDRSLYPSIFIVCRIVVRRSGSRCRNRCWSSSDSSRWCCTRSRSRSGHRGRCRTRNPIHIWYPKELIPLFPQLRIVLIDQLWSCSGSRGGCRYRWRRTSITSRCRSMQDIPSTRSSV
jgi:hypothetical protein